MLGTHLVDDTVDCGFGAVVVGAKLVDRRAATVGAEDIGFLRVGEGACPGGKNGCVGVGGIVEPEGSADGFDAASGALGELTRDFGLARPGLGHLFGALDIFLALVVGELAELGATLDALRVVFDKTVDAASEESDPFAAVENEAAADEAKGAPARDGFGRDIKTAWQVGRR